jgi:ribosomal protein S14
MNSKVKRYDPINSDGTCGMCVEDADYGAYVEFADYAALEAECERLREALDRQSVITGDYIARCQRCGRMLPVGYPFKICDPCFRHSSIIA